MDFQTLHIVSRIRGAIADEAKKSYEGLPVQSLKHMILRGDSCRCRQALRLLAENN
jgi:hypothetical protein